jgi:hypothetical protein
MFKLILIGMLPLTACVGLDTFEMTNLCNELPTVSLRDTDQTIIEVDNFNAKYKALYCNA